jgi:hypothetical protein
VCRRRCFLLARRCLSFDVLEEAQNHPNAHQESQAIVKVWSTTYRSTTTTARSTCCCCKSSNTCSCSSLRCRWSLAIGMPSYSSSSHCSSHRRWHAWIHHHAATDSREFFSSQVGKIDCDQLCTCTTISSSWSSKEKLITSATQKLQLQIVSLALLCAQAELSLSPSLARSKSGWTFRHLFVFSNCRQIWIALGVFRDRD